MKAARLLPCLLLGACAYFNGIYNARSAERRGDALRREGKDGEAVERYAAAAATAETVLARYPRSRWADDALYLAGRAAAYAGRCDEALARLERYLERARPADLSRRARLARAVCYIQLGRHTPALAELRALLALRDRSIATEAALWAGRAALAQGDREEARRLFGAAGASTADWEMLPAAIADSDAVGLEALLLRRAAAGDWRAGSGERALRALAGARGLEPVKTVIARYDASSTPLPARMRLHLLAADLSAEAGMDGAAREHIARASRLGADSALARGAEARLALLSIRQARTFEDLERAARSAGAGARASDSLRRAEERVLLVRLLARRATEGGAPLFLAGEVARDSLGAPALALDLFRRAASAPGDPAAAAQALLAAATLAPDSAPAYLERVRTRFPGSPAAMLLAGRDPADAPDFEPMSERLRTVWAGATAEWADSVRARQARGAAADSASRARTSPPG